MYDLLECMHACMLKIVMLCDTWAILYKLFYSALQLCQMASDHPVVFCVSCCVFYFFFRIGLNETTLTASFQGGDATNDFSIGLDNATGHMLLPDAAPQNPGNNGNPHTEPGGDPLPVTPAAEQAADSSETAGNPLTDDLSSKLQAAFDGLLGGNSIGSFEEMAKKERVVVTLSKLLELFGGGCESAGCERQKEVHHKVQGGVLIVTWNCGGGRGGVWESSDVLVQKERGQKLYVNTVMLAASILLSGNNFSKTSLWSRCLNLGFISSSTFDRIQKLYAIPAVQSFWSDMKTVVHEVMKNEKVVLSGDGRNDSPGFSAQYCVYSLMEAVTKVIVDIEVKDKRETGGTSTVMEVAALKCLLERLVETMSIGELTTDASASVIAMVKKLKGEYLHYNISFFICVSFSTFNR